jgi:hypothetical protein
MMSLLKPEGRPKLLVIEGPGNVTLFVRICRYVMTWDCAPWMLKVWVPAVITLVSVIVVGAEVRIFVGFVWGV